jgi:alpha-beta hydrolase superfamily lysophospholipase
MTFEGRQMLESPTGAVLNLRAAHAASPRAVIQINHGLAEHSARYGRFAGFLAERGFHVYAQDHRGHGTTTAPDAGKGSFGRGRPMTNVIADVLAVHEHIASRYSGLPVIIFGQGTGALIALQFLLGHAPRVSGAALWNLPVAEEYGARFLAAMLRWERFRLGSDVPSPTMRRILAGWNRKAGGGETGFEWLSDNPAAVEAYVADPLCAREPTISAWLDIARMMRQAGSPARWAGLPSDFHLHLAAGAADPATEGGKQVERLARNLKQAGFSNLVSRVYAEKRHDLVNSLNRNLIWEDFVEWADSIATRTDSQ